MLIALAGEHVPSKGTYLRAVMVSFLFLLVELAPTAALALDPARVALIVQSFLARFGAVGRVGPDTTNAMLVIQQLAANLAVVQAGAGSACVLCRR